MHLTPLPCWLSALPRIKHEAKQIKNATFYSGLTPSKAQVFHYVPAHSHRGLCGTENRDYGGRGKPLQTASINTIKEWRLEKPGWKRVKRGKININVSVWLWLNSVDWKNAKNIIIEKTLPSFFGFVKLTLQGNLTTPFMPLRQASASPECRAAASSQESYGLPIARGGGHY